MPILMAPSCTYPYLDAGHTMAQVVYDLDLAMQDVMAFLQHYQPDTATFLACFEGQGEIMEKAGCKNYLWAGMPGAQIPEDSLQQFIEFPLFEDDEFEDFLYDRTWTTLTKAFPKMYKVFEPFSKLNVVNTHAQGIAYDALAFSLAQPEVQQMLGELLELAGMWGAYYGQIGGFSAAVEAAGFPFMSSAPPLAPFDLYSDFYRGTMGASIDIIDHAEEMHPILAKTLASELAFLNFMPPVPNRFTYIYLHKGMDGFLSDEQYRSYYWGYLKPIIDLIVEKGAIPIVFTEGKYSSRFEFLKTLPPGKCIVHFEDVDMARAKKELEGIACISGNLKTSTISYGTKAQVLEEAKRLLDACAPGGGYAFDLDGILAGAPRENVEALFEFLKEEGRY